MNESCTTLVFLYRLDLRYTFHVGFGDLLCYYHYYQRILCTVDKVKFAADLLLF